MKLVQFSAERLREDVRYVIGSGNPVDEEAASVNMFTDEMKLNVYVLRARVV